VTGDFLNKKSKVKGKGGRSTGSRVLQGKKRVGNLLRKPRGARNRERTHGKESQGAKEKDGQKVALVKECLQSTNKEKKKRDIQSKKDGGGQLRSIILGPSDWGEVPLGPQKRIHRAENGDGGWHWGSCNGRCKKKDPVEQLLRRTAKKEKGK